MHPVKVSLFMAAAVVLAWPASITSEAGDSRRRSNPEKRVAAQAIKNAADLKWDSASPGTAPQRAVEDRGEVSRWWSAPIAEGPGAAAADGIAGVEGQSEGVTLCHCPPGNPDNCHTIVVEPRGVNSHLRHGDTLGACPGDESPSQAACSRDRRLPAIG